MEIGSGKENLRYDLVIPMERVLEPPLAVPSVAMTVESIEGIDIRSLLASSEAIAFLLHDRWFVVNVSCPLKRHQVQAVSRWHVFGEPGTCSVLPARIQLRRR
ncbi:hypothetical protein [Ferrimicrobium sp.]|uniref:hypothetical protein n=1 Tax=Ferrimicrobium sp. TaxID=2926050 RepID=UPI00263354CF|nr:hypothetical protein [Ferrimicrobium sp.]